MRNIIGSPDDDSSERRKEGRKNIESKFSLNGKKKIQVSRGVRGFAKPHANINEGDFNSPSNSPSSVKKKQVTWADIVRGNQV
jgi:hypothetical protein